MIPSQPRQLHFSKEAFLFWCSLLAPWQGKCYRNGQLFLSGWYNYWHQGTSWFKRLLGHWTRFPDQEAARKRTDGSLPRALQLLMGELNRLSIIWRKKEHSFHIWVYPWWEYYRHVYTTGTCGCSQPHNSILLARCSPPQHDNLSCAHSTGLASTRRIPFFQNAVMVWSATSWLGVTSILLRARFTCRWVKDACLLQCSGHLKHLANRSYTNWQGWHGTHCWPFHTCSALRALLPSPTLAHHILAGDLCEGVNPRALLSCLAPDSQCSDETQSSPQPHILDRSRWRQSPLGCMPWFRESSSLGRVGFGWFTPSISVQLLFSLLFPCVACVNGPEKLCWAIRSLAA